MSSDGAPDANMATLLARALGADYEVREVIGRGGFAEVHAVWDRRLKRELAVKIARADRDADTEQIARFRREAEVIASLRHPHITPIYSVGESEGFVYLTMPRLQGETLADRIEHGPPLGVERVLRIIADIGKALTAAHGAGVVHRDVKPENIFLERPDGRAQLMDFGIAKVRSAINHATLAHVEGGDIDRAAPAAAPMSPELTSAGTIVGTPRYMSPEQAAGDAVIDARTDQYALGLVGWRALTGRMPFEAASLRELIVMQVTEPVPSLAKYAPDVPEGIARAVMRALEKDPAKRFPSIAEFLEALGEPIRPWEGVDPDAAVATSRAAAWWSGGAAVLGLTLFVALAPREFRSARAYVPIPRDSAVAIARRVRPAVIHEAPARQAIELLVADTVHRFVASRLRSGAATEAWMRERHPLLAWHVRWVDATGRRLGDAHVWTDGRVSALWKPGEPVALAGGTNERRLDTAVALARALMPGVLPEGIAPAVTSDTDEVGHRTLAWPSAQILPGETVSTADSALRRVTSLRVALHGGEPISIAQGVVVPLRERVALANRSRQFDTALLVAYVAAAIAALAYVLGALRQLSPALRLPLRSLRRLVVFSSVAFWTSLIANAYFGDSSTGVFTFNWWNVKWFLLFAALSGLLGLTAAAGLYFVAAAARMSFPRGLAGTRDFLQGRLATPPVVRAAWIGVLATCVVLGVRATAWLSDGVRLAQSKFTPDGSRVPLGAWADVAIPFAFGLINGVLLLLGYSAVRSLVRRPRVAFATMVAILVLLEALRILSGVAPAPGWVVVAVVAYAAEAAIMVWALESAGWLAVAAATTLLELTWDGGQWAAVPNAGSQAIGLVSIAMALAFAFAAIVGRLRRQPHLHAPIDRPVAPGDR